MKKNDNLFKEYDISSLLSTSIFPPAAVEEDYDKHGMDWQKAKRFAEDTGHRKGLIRWVKGVVSSWFFQYYLWLLLINYWASV
jgi:hypothetical protein